MIILSILAMKYESISNEVNKDISSKPTINDFLDENYSIKVTRIVKVIPFNGTSKFSKVSWNSSKLLENSGSLCWNFLNFSRSPKTYRIIFDLFGWSRNSMEVLCCWLCRKLLVFLSFSYVHWISHTIPEILWSFWKVPEHFDGSPSQSEVSWIFLNIPEYIWLFVNSSKIPEILIVIKNK